MAEEPADPCNSDGYIHLPESVRNDPVLGKIDGQRIRFAGKAMRRCVYERDGGKCHYCGAAVTLEGFQADHKVPFSKGGLTVLDNLLCSCRLCNLAKGDASYEQFVAELAEKGLEWRNDIAQKQANWFADQRRLALGQI